MIVIYVLSLLEKVKKILKNIGLTLIAGLFMLSATGLYFTIHQCKLENFTLFFLFTPSSGYCEHEISCQTAHTCNDVNAFSSQCHSAQANDPVASCPSLNIPGCCSDPVLHIDIDEDFVRTEKSDINICNIQLQQTFGFELMSALSNPMDHFLYSSLHPPGKTNGRQLSLLNRQLLL